MRKQRLQPCQKQPSTKIATFCRGKTKSGFPYSWYPLRHPMTLCSRKTVISLSSVLRFPLERIAAMTRERFSGVKTSTLISN
jgi:hypothetical protein